MRNMTALGLVSRVSPLPVNGLVEASLCKGIRAHLERVAFGKQKPELLHLQIFFPHVKCARGFSFPPVLGRTLKAITLVVAWIRKHRSAPPGSQDPSRRG